MLVDVLAVAFPCFWAVVPLGFSTGLFATFAFCGFVPAWWAGVVCTGLAAGVVCVDAGLAAVVDLAVIAGLAVVVAPVLLWANKPAVARAKTADIMNVFILLSSN